MISKSGDSHILRQKLAYEGKVVSQLIYKHCSAHRAAKYFQALKKVNRHLHHFAKLGVFGVLEDGKKTAALDVLKTGDVVLGEIERNCMEVVQHSLGKIALMHFVPFLSMSVATASCIRAIVKDIRATISDRVTGKVDIQLSYPSVSQCDDFDVGNVILRENFENLVQSDQATKEQKPSSSLETMDSPNEAEINNFKLLESYKDQNHMKPPISNHLCQRPKSSGLNMKSKADINNLSKPSENLTHYNAKVKTTCSGLVTSQSFMKLTRKRKALALLGRSSGLNKHKKLRKNMPLRMKKYHRRLLLQYCRARNV